MKLLRPPKNINGNVNVVENTKLKFNIIYKPAPTVLSSILSK